MPGVLGTGLGSVHRAGERDRIEEGRDKATLGKVTQVWSDILGREKEQRVPTGDSKQALGGGWYAPEPTWENRAGQIYVRCPRGGDWPTSILALGIEALDLN